MQDIDVLIIGGGPTGMMLALELAMQNVTFRIVDKEPIRSDKSRALVVHPRSLELLNRHSIAHELIELGRLALGLRLFVNKKLVTEFELGDLGFDDTAFTSVLFISQADTERFLDKALSRYGKAVERPVTAEKLEQDESGVRVWLKGADGVEEQVRCKYVVGCDGAHSVVRRAAELEFEGAAYSQDFVLADVHIEWDHPADCLTLFMAQGMLIGFPMSGGLFRLVATRPSDLSNHDEPTLADFQDLFDRMAPGTGKLYDPVWISRFRLHHRATDHYRMGRLFLAGDAAHIHSPVGGQGMNTGMQDSVNLGWKLARVIRGEKDDSLLDSYDVERHKVGERLLRTTDRFFRLGATSNYFLSILRNTFVPWVLSWVASERSRRARIFRFISQLGIRYRNSPIVGTASTYRGPLRGGDRAPNETIQGADGETNLLELCIGPTHHLILFSGTGLTATDGQSLEGTAVKFLKANPDWVKVHKILSASSPQSSGYVDPEGKVHSRYGFTEPGYALVRPDGHVAHIGPLSAMEELQEWVKK